MLFFFRRRGNMQLTMCVDPCFVLYKALERFIPHFELSDDEIKWWLKVKEAKKVSLVEIPPNVLEKLKEKINDDYQYTNGDSPVRFAYALICDPVGL